MAVTTFDVSPKDGALAYTVQGRDVNLLVRTDADGGQRTVLLEDAYISNVRWSPDGSRIAVSINSPTETPPTRVNGVYIISADGGKPQLLQANDTFLANVDTVPDPYSGMYVPYKLIMMGPIDSVVLPSESTAR